ncbi:hypothetical protein JCGZ_07787 [Jatropha curcas]|uniref:non-specific serine/threonine protein kinase n=1 Tax=Jatropha curcas TaxID=180498 RepID=A0A067KDE8_JATCU|nr:hypothetical protein JCGZ_07787 [Jatropha curcas]
MSSPSISPAPAVSLVALSWPLPPIIAPFSSPPAPPLFVENASPQPLPGIPPFASPLPLSPLTPTPIEVAGAPSLSPSLSETPLTPLPTPSRATKAAPPPLTSQYAPSPFPPPPAETTPSSILPPAPSSFPLAPPTAAKSPGLSLPLANGNLPESSKQSHVSTGLIVGCVIGGVFLLLLFGLICIRNRNRRSSRRRSTTAYRPPSLEPKDNCKTIVAQHSQQNSWPDGAHVIRVQTGTFSLSPTSTSCGEENPMPIHGPSIVSGLSIGTFTYDELVAATNGFADANLIGEGGFGYVHKGFLGNGQEVAVKQLKEGSRQGEREFLAEIEIINRVHHKHLVSLIGHCIAATKRLLVYEFIPNNTLEFHLHGTAKELAYLHEDCNPTIVHRDIRAANILLDHNFEAKNSHHRTQPIGLPAKKESLVNWARPLLTEAIGHGNFKAFVDPRLENNYNTNQMASMVACAAACVRHSSWLRPQMSKVVRALEGHISAMDLYEVTEPDHNTLYDFASTSDYDHFQYNHDRKEHDMALSSRQYGISGYSGTTSEYGLNPSSSSSDSSNR